MDRISIASKNQTAANVLDQIDEFFSHFHIPNHASSLRRLEEARLHRSLFDKAHFFFAIPGEKLFQWHRYQRGASFRQGRGLMMCSRGRDRTGVGLYRFFDRLTGDDRESVLIIDDSTCDRSWWSCSVE
jgi:hypothetical protein